MKSTYRGPEGMVESASPSDQLGVLTFVKFEFTPWIVLFTSGPLNMSSSEATSIVNSGQLAVIKTPTHLKLLLNPFWMATTA